MTYGQDPFEARQREALRATDALLDRIGARTPTPHDLQDPLVTALAQLATEIDLDAVPVETTRAAVARSLPSSGSEPDDAPGAFLDLRRSEEPERSAEPLRRPQRPRSAPASTGAMAPPRSLARVSSSGDSSRPGARGDGSRPGGRRDRRLRPMAAIVVAVAAIVLGTGISAVVTGGRSVNPLEGLQQVVADLTGGRTADQQRLYDRDRRYIEVATAAARAGNRTNTINALNRVETRGLSSEDQADLARRVQKVFEILDRSGGSTSP